MFYLPDYDVIIVAMGKKKQKLMIIDGNALIHRSFHALPPTMATKTGQPTNAIYGFVTVLLKAIREIKPDFIVLTLDKKGPTFRQKIFADYKATREKAPAELYEQIPWVKKIARALGIPIFEKQGLEADDLIGAIVQQANGGLEKIIVTGDLDTLQLVNPTTKVYTLSRGLAESVLYDEAMVKKRYGLTPSQIVDFKALRGDPSDNIPGVRGIGEKTASQLLQHFKTLDNLYAFLQKHPDGGQKIKPRIAELLKKQKKLAYLSKKLATIKQDAKIKFDLSQARLTMGNQDEIIELFSQLEFKSLLPRLKALLETNQSQAQAAAEKFTRNQKNFNYQLVDNEKKFQNLLKQLRQLQKKPQPHLTLDTETTSSDPLTAEIIGLSLSWQKGQAFFVYIPPTQRKKSARSEPAASLFASAEPANSGYNRILKRLKPFLTDKKIKKSAHNFKFDWRVLKSYGLTVANIYFDTMVASYLLNPGSRQHNLDAVVFSELGYTKISKSDLLGTGKNKLKFSQLDRKKLALYSAEDADFTHRLVPILKKQLQKQKLDKLFAEIEMPLIPVLAKMEDNGIRIDTEFLKKLNKKISRQIQKIQKQIWQIAQTEFNINSTQQLQAVLFEKLKISADGIAKTKTGLSTAAAELAKLKNRHPIIILIQEFRELTKLKNTYIASLPKLVNPQTGRLHTSFNQTVTATGRLSSTDPNLQNIPVRTKLGKQIRQAFVAEKGWQLVSLDYSQIELRLAAHLAGDEKMIKAFQQGADIHTATAAEINQINPEAVTPQLRRQAKAINFGILYGQGPHGLAQAADIPYGRAKEFIEQYFLVYQGIKKFIEKTIRQAQNKGYVETLFGRRRYLPEINSSIAQVRKAAERMAINMPLQGTAADMIKLAMIKTDKFLQKTNQPTAKARLLLQVHDELLLEIKKAEAQKLALAIKQIMEKIIKLKVPIIVDVKIGANWGELKKITEK